MIRDASDDAGNRMRRSLRRLCGDSMARILKVTEMRLKDATERVQSHARERRRKAGRNDSLTIRRMVFAGADFLAEIFNRDSRGI